MRASILTTVAYFALSTLACSETSDFIITFYAWPDNDPPSADTAYGCGSKNYIAGGTGTYADPLTMAAVEGRFAQCEMVYSPYLKKYLRSEDTCANCVGDWIDIWTGSNTQNEGALVEACELALTLGRFLL